MRVQLVRAYPIIEGPAEVHRWVVARQPPRD